MFSAWSNLKLLLCLTLGFAVLPFGVIAAGDAKLANRTIERTVSLRTHSIYPPYIDQDLQNRWWDFGADAYINTNKHIRLTRARPSQMGWLWSRLPLTSANFIVEVEFKISGDTGHLFGDGLAIWLTTTRAQPGPVFGSVDNFEGLGVFLDTYANSRHGYAFPRVVGMLGDGKTSYDLENDGEATKIGACGANYRRTNVATKLKITYIKDAYLDVKIQYKAWDEWSDCFTVPNVELPLAPFLGFSALTGDVFDNHDIISITTYSAILSSPDAPRDKIGVGIGSSSRLAGSSSYFWTLVKFALFVGVCAGAFYGYRTYSSRQGGAGLGMGGQRFGNNFGGLYDSKRF
ncbi:unnamed protein product [Somion occarium]|uniref:L-type lectin-like domain-containing protein n=1 Tax=Somion occarium TaxID=3059160 RepID=A0ABP1DWS0_9APHY